MWKDQKFISHGAIQNATISFPHQKRKEEKKKAVATLTDYLNVVPNVQFTAANETGAFNEAVAAGSLSHSLQERKLCLLGHSE